KCWHCEVVAVPSTDLLTHMDDWIIPGREYLWISFSRSGDSPEGVAVLEQARKKHPHIRHFIVSCNAQGRMIRESSVDRRTMAVALEDAVNDRGLAMTSSFSNMLIFGQCLAHVQDRAQYETILLQLMEASKSFLSRAADLASKLAGDDYAKACFLGSGALRGVAKESALKLSEMTAGKTLTMSESVMGLRHGPMAALDRDTLLVTFISSDSRIQKYERDLLLEIGNKRLVRSRVIVGPQEMSHAKGMSEQFLSTGESFLVSDDYRPALDVIFGQLLGLFFSLRCNLQPDSPSPNGVISRVVNNVIIHS
ncbi:MAG TPA: tagatose-6-phosphate ketose isomerase, partial [Candidatus Sulfotelmatobacter sp.]